MAYERVYTVFDYYDGPRDGLADYHGKPHRYQSQWDEVAGDWADTFILTPVDQGTLESEMERWQIWRAWERAFHAGEVPHESHPGFGGKNERYDELGELIASRLRGIEPLDIRPVASFRAVEAMKTTPGIGRELEVEWSLPPTKQWKS